MQKLIPLFFRKFGFAARREFFLKTYWITEQGARMRAAVEPLGE